MRKAVALFLISFVIFALLAFSRGRQLGVASREVQIILAGDVMLGRTVMTISLDKKDLTYPWHLVATTLQSADLVFANLENPIVSNCPRHYDGFKFCADPGMIEGLKFGGVDVVTLANNHSGNYGEMGLAETKKLLIENGIEYTKESLATKQVGNLVFGFLGLDFVDKNITEDQIGLIKAFDKQVDVLVIGVHWGVEYQSVAGSKQRETAKILVESGGDVIVGSHPHWVQNVEYIDGPPSPDGSVEARPVYYSLGNFIFDQMWSEETKKGLAMRLTFDANGKLKNEEKLPTYMQNWAQPKFVNDLD